MDYRKLIAKEIAKVLKKKEIHIENMLEVPPQKELGDYAFPCFSFAKELKKSPNEISADINAKIRIPKGIKQAKTVGPYLNFFVEEGSLAENVIAEVLEKKEDYGSNKNIKKKVMIEYSGPNTNKPLHVGHLRNDSTGMAASKIVAFNGANVVKAGLFSDRGAHICKSMIAYKKWGKGSTPESSKMKGDHFVGKYYVMFAQKEKENPALVEEAISMLDKWEKGDKEVRALWKKMDKWGTDGFKETYKKFGSEFDVILRESQFYDKAKPIIETGLKKGVFEEDEAITAKLKKYGLPDKVVLRKDGTSIYITNDLAMTKHKFEHYKIDESIWVVGADHKLYFRQLFKIFELLGFKWAKNCRHLSYEMIYLPEGRLKSREGKVVDADELIAKAEDAALAEVKKRYPKQSEKEKKKRASVIGLAAIKFFMLKTDTNKSILFDIKNSVSFDGETGPYVQYSYARARSILKKAGVREKDVNKLKKADLGLLSNEDEKEVVKQIAVFKDVVEEAGRKLAPEKICQFLLEISSVFNHFYHSQNVLQAEEKTKEARLALVYATAQTIKNGLNLLNIDVLEEM